MTNRQAALVSFLACFVTVIGALVLAYYFKRHNRKESI